MLCSRALTAAIDVTLVCDIIECSCSAFLANVSASSNVEHPLSRTNTFKWDLRPRTQLFDLSGSFVPAIWKRLIMSLA